MSGGHGLIRRRCRRCRRQHLRQAAHRNRCRCCRRRRRRDVSEKPALRRLSGRIDRKRKSGVGNIRTGTAATTTTRSKGRTTVGWSCTAGRCGRSTVQSIRGETARDAHRRDRCGGNMVGAVHRCCRCMSGSPLVVRCLAMHMCHVVARRHCIRYGAMCVDVHTMRFEQIMWPRCVYLHTMQCERMVFSR